MWVWSLSQEDCLETEMATHFSILAWKNPMDREAWRATVHGSQSWTWLSDWARMQQWFKTFSHMLICRLYAFFAEIWLDLLSIFIQFSSVQLLSHVWLFAIPWTAARQASLSITNSRVHPNPCPLSRWCHPTISSSVIPFSSCPQSFPASGSFPMSWFFTSIFLENS